MKKHHKVCSLYSAFNKTGTPDQNRTDNCPLGGDCYIHLTTEAY